MQASSPRRPATPILLDASVDPRPRRSLARIAELGEPIEELKTAGGRPSVAAAIDGSRETCRAVECAMGNLVADAMLDRVTDQGVTIAIAERRRPARLDRRGRR